MPGLWGLPAVSSIIFSSVWRSSSTCGYGNGPLFPYLSSLCLCLYKRVSQFYLSIQLSFPHFHQHMESVLLPLYSVSLFCGRVAPKGHRSWVFLAHAHGPRFLEFGAWAVALSGAVLSAGGQTVNPAPLRGPQVSVPGGALFCGPRGALGPLAWATEAEWLAPLCPQPQLHESRSSDQVLKLPASMCPSQSLALASLSPPFPGMAGGSPPSRGHAFGSLSPCALSFSSKPLSGLPARPPEWLGHGASLPSLPGAQAPLWSLQSWESSACPLLGPSRVTNSPAPSCPCL